MRVHTVAYHIQPQVVVSFCLETFVTLHNDGDRLSWMGGGVNTILKWILTDLDDTHLQQVIFTCRLYTIIASQ